MAAEIKFSADGLPVVPSMRLDDVATSVGVGVGGDKPSAAAPSADKSNDDANAHSDSDSSVPEPPSGESAIMASMLEKSADGLSTVARAKLAAVDETAKSATLKPSDAGGTSPRGNKPQPLKISEEVDFTTVEWESSGATSTLRGLKGAKKVEEFGDSAPASPLTTPRGGASDASATPRGEPKTLLPPKEVTKGEQEFAKKLLRSTGDEMVNVYWVTKVNAKGEAQARMLVVGLYRIYSIKRRWNGKKEVRRDGHYLDLFEIVSDTPDHVVLNFTRDYMREPFVLDARATGIGNSLPKDIAGAMQRWAFDLPQSKMPKLKRDRAPAIDFTAPTPLPDTMGGFLALYKAVSNYEALAVSHRVVKFLEANGPKRTHMWLNRISKIRDAQLVPLRPVVIALKYNRHFKSYMLSSVDRPSVLSALAVAVRCNPVLRRIIVSRCGVRSEGAILLGKALTANKQSLLTHIDISGNAIGDRGLLGLVEGLRSLSHTLHALRLADCQLTSKSLAPLFFAFVDVNGGVLTSGMQELDISLNDAGSVTTNAMINWLRVGALSVDNDAAKAGGESKRRPPQLVKLCIDASKIDVGRLADALLQAPLLSHLESLSLGGSKLTVPTAPGQAPSLAAVCALVKAAPSLNSLAVHSCGLESNHLVELINALDSSSSSRSCELDFNDNAIGANGVAAFVNALKKSKRVTSLNIRGNKLTIDGTIALLEGLLAAGPCPLLQKLDELMLSFEFVRRGGDSKKTPIALQRLGEFCCLKTSALSKLVMYGSPEKYSLGRDLVPFLRQISPALLVYLDISGNMLEDGGVGALCEFIAQSKSLNTLLIDKNHFSLNGFSQIRDAMNKSLALCNLPYPKHDIDLICSSGRTNAKKIHAVLLEIKELLKRNRKREENIKVTWIGEDELGDDDEDDDDATNDVEASEVDLASAATIKASSSSSSPSSALSASAVVAEEPDINEDNLGSATIRGRKALTTSSD